MQMLFDGFALGLLYALVALGMVLVYRATGVLNLAQGAIVSTSAYLVWYLSSALPGGFFVAVPLTVIAAGLLSLLVSLLLKLLPSAPPLTQTVATYGVGLIIAWAAQAAFGTRSQVLFAPWDFNGNFLGIRVSGSDLTVILLLLV